MDIVANCMNFVGVADVGKEVPKACSTRKIMLEATA